MSAGWWKKEGKDVASEIWAHLDQLETRQRSRVSRDYINELIYSGGVGVRGKPAEGFGGFNAADMNFTRSIVDTMVARIANDRPAVKYAATGASWKQRRTAKQRDKVVEGFLESSGMAEKGPMALRDCLMTRGGVIGVEGSDGRIVADRFPCEELFHDERESRYGEPRSMHRVMRASKEVLAAKFKSKAGLIMAAPPPKARPNDIEWSSSGMDSGMCDVAISHHLPSKKGAGDGRRIISLANAVLLEEEYKRPTFPYAIIRYSPPRRGFWGNSLVDELAQLQFKVNEVAGDLQRNIYFTSAVKVLQRRGANIAKKTVSGKVPHFIDVDAIGADLQWAAPDGFSMAQFNFLQWLIAQMYEVSRVSQLTAAGKNPLGAGASGAALDAQYDIENEGHSQLERAYAQLWCDVARLGLEAAQDMAEDEGFRQSEMRWQHGNAIQQVKWADVDLDDDQFELHLEASGFLPSSRVGKMRAVESLVAAGMIDPKWATSLLDFPDLKNATAIQNAPVETALWVMGELEDAELSEDETEVDEDKSAPIPAPDPHDDLEFLMGVAKAVHAIKKTEKAPAPILARFVTYMDTLQAEMDKLKPASTGQVAPPADPMMAGAPPGMAGPAPMPDPMMALPPMGVTA